MGLNAAKIGLAVQQGLNVICATCEHYWDAKDRGAELCGKSCGGPVAGKAFPAYKGPIRDMSAQCFVCGEGTVFLVRHPARRFGVCSRHERMVRSWCDKFLIQFDQVEALPFKKKTLREAIAEVENHYAEKEG